MELFTLLLLVVAMACFLIDAFERSARSFNLGALGLFFLTSAFFLGQLDKL